MCDEGSGGSFIPGPLAVLSGITETLAGLVCSLVGGAVSSGPALGIGLATLAAGLFVMTHLLLVTVCAGVFGVAVLGVVQLLKRGMVVNSTLRTVPTRAQARSRRVPAYPLPRNLAITTGQRALPAPPVVPGDVLSSYCPGDVDNAPHEGAQCLHERNAGPQHPGHDGRRSRRPVRPEASHHDGRDAAARRQ